MARYSLFVLKVPLNTNKANKQTSPSYAGFFKRFRKKDVSKLLVWDFFPAECPSPN